VKTPGHLFARFNASLIAADRPPHVAAILFSLFDIAGIIPTAPWGDAHVKLNGLASRLFCFLLK
jgi:hypothetical protein